MMPRYIDVKRVAALAFFLALFPAAVAAEPSYPSRALRIIVPVPPGAAADTLPRALAERLAARFGQPVVIDNKPGANSNVGAELAAKSQPDGYTLLATPPPPLVINQRLYALRFDPAGFVPVSVLATLSNVLVTRPGAPFASVGELIAYAKSHPGKVSYASAGVGSSPHLAMEWLAHVAGARMTHVPYNGLAQALTHVLAGHVDLMFNNTANVLPLVNERKLIALAVDGEKRVPGLDGVPALSETFPGYVMSTWFAIVAPPGTPSAIAEKLSVAIAHALREPDLRRRFSDLSAIPVGSTPADTATFIRRERERWYGIVEAAGIKVD